VFRRQADELIRRQQDDGGWSQLDGGESDAYATGQALVTLLGTGQLRPAQRVVRRGLDYLLSTQLADGSWYVKSRSKAFQKQFESGFPHGKDQFISIAASSWATMAITLALPIRSARSRSVSIRSVQRGKRAKGAD
jgi:squalene cyclase